MLRLYKNETNHVLISLCAVIKKASASKQLKIATNISENELQIKSKQAI